MNNSLIATMAQDVLSIPSTENVTDLTELINKQLELEHEIIRLDDELKQRQYDLKMLSEETIPNVFLTLGISELSLDDGSKVKVTPYYAASIKEENQVVAFEWLRDNDHDDLIKHEIKVGFGKGEDEEAAELKKTLAELNVNYTDKEFVHPMTLKAFVKEQVENVETAAEFPRETFSVYVGKKTKITPPKIKKER